MVKTTKVILWYIGSIPIRLSIINQKKYKTMIHEFNDLQIKYGKEVTLINFFKVSIEIIKNNERILLIPYFMSFDCAQLLTSPNYN